MEFNGDIQGYIEHVERYRKYTDIKDRMRQIEENFSKHEPSHLPKNISPGLKVESKSVIAASEGIASQQILIIFQKNLNAQR